MKKKVKKRQPLKKRKTQKTVAKKNNFIKTCEKGFYMYYAAPLFFSIVISYKPLQGSRIPKSKWDLVVSFFPFSSGASCIGSLASKEGRPKIFFAYGQLLDAESLNDLAFLRILGRF